MCLIAVALGAHPRWPLVIASNRDEFRARPTAPLACWTTPVGTTVLAGRDLQDGGTWLGVTPAGRVAMLTNVRRGEARAGLRSRGGLVTRWLDSGADAAAFAKGIAPADYAGFNLLVGDHVRGEWHWMGNADGPRLAVQRIATGIHGLSNARLNTPWPKTVRLTQVLRDELASAPDAATLQHRLMLALKDPTRAPTRDLPNTGVPADMEHGLSAAWVDLPAYGYGTRTSTVLVAEPNRVDTPVTVWETTHGVTGPDTVCEQRLVWPGQRGGVQRL